MTGSSTIQELEIDRLDSHLQFASAITVTLFRLVAESERAAERLCTLRRAGKTAVMDRLLEAGAYTDAAIVLLGLEMPNWKIRRLVYENGEWLCSLSRQPNAPIEFDEMAEGVHRLLALAVLRALLEARRLKSVERACKHSPDNRRLEYSLGPSVPVHCDNFS